MEYTEKELEQERWKPIFGYDGMYEVSDLGRVRSLKFGKTRVLRVQKHTDGYLLVALCKYGKRKSFYVHRLVASAFVENDNLFNTEINHIDECKQNNRVSNLEYCDRSYNVSYNGLRKKQHHPQAKREKVKDLYNPNLTYRQNIEIFKANGIECSTMVVYKLRKEIGLKTSRNQYVLKEIKDIYRPDLSYQENIKLFRANNIECCNATLYKLRKELGLAKKYKK